MARFSYFSVFLSFLKKHYSYYYSFLSVFSPYSKKISFFIYIYFLIYIQTNWTGCLGELVPHLMSNQLAPALVLELVQALPEECTKYVTHSSVVILVVITVVVVVVLLVRGLVHLLECSLIILYSTTLFLSPPRPSWYYGRLRRYRGIQSVDNENSKNSKVKISSYQYYHWYDFDPNSRFSLTLEYITGKYPVNMYVLRFLQKKWQETVFFFFPPN